MTVQLAASRAKSTAILSFLLCPTLLSADHPSWVSRRIGNIPSQYGSYFQGLSSVTGIAKIVVLAGGATDRPGWLTWPTEHDTGSKARSIDISTTMLYWQDTEIHGICHFN
ncbi:hypothetical protein [Sphingobium sp. EM0848]|uniref:hypothetical protein n=1 Tax=Sphingobium sp. EM0848 TaxID=2743473 RepID=UPI00159C1494|nr:hypothetical protein [Sphingobium sp. EM0848]